MVTISKRFKFRRMWEIVMIDGKIHFLVKDMLPYFGFSDRSQQSVRSSVADSRIKVLTGEPVRDLKHAHGRAMVVTTDGLIEFINNREPRSDRSRELIQFMYETIIPEMERLWEKKIGEMPDHQIKLFPAPETDDVMQLIQEMKDRIESLEKQVRTQQNEIMQLQETPSIASSVHQEDGRMMVDADAFIKSIKLASERAGNRMRGDM